MRNIDRRTAEKLEAFLDGKLTGRERDEMERLARNTETYRDYLVYLKGIKLVASLTSVERAPADMADRVMNRIMAPKQVVSFYRGWAPMALAAAACLVIGLSVGAQLTAPGMSNTTSSSGFNSVSIVRHATALDNFSEAVDALKNGDAQTAKIYLSAGEKAADFAQLKAKGLNMVVVNELLNQGDTLSLAEYLENYTGKQGKIQL